MEEANFIQFIYEQVGVQGIWFALFIYLFVTQDKKNKIREEKMEQQLKESNVQINNFIAALQDLKEVKETLKDLKNDIGKK